MTTTEDVQGRLRVLQVTNTTMETWLEIHSLTLSPTWQYEGEAEFESATIPPDQSLLVVYLGEGTSCL
jgi:hypothetical protein